VSTVAAVKVALVAVVRAAVPDAQVVYGPATGVSLDADKLITVGTVTGVSELDSLSATTTAEDYRVDVIFSFTLPGADTQQLVTQTVLADWLAVKAAVLASQDLGVAGVLAARPTGDFRLTETADPGGRNAALVTGVQVRASAV
jgi:hypothetical protein